MITRLLVTVTATLGLYTAAPAASIEVSPNKPTLVISGVIAQGNIIPVGEKLLELASAGEKEAQLIINSPGGQVTTGFMFLSLMDAAKQKGLKITCFVPQVAASMAYQIFLHCNERHVLNNTFLLWHRARVMLGGGLFSPGVIMTGPEALKLGKDLELTDDAIFSDIIKFMGKHVDIPSLKYHFEVETLHIGLNLHKLAPRFITSHSAIPGLLDHLTSAKKKSKEEGPEMSIDSFKDKEIIYISERFAQ